MTDLINISIEPCIMRTCYKCSDIAFIGESTVIYSFKNTKYVHSDSQIPVKIIYKNYSIKQFISLSDIISNFPIDMLITALPNVIFDNDNVFLQTFDSCITVKTSKDFYQQYLSKEYDQNNIDIN